MLGDKTEKKCSKCKLIKPLGEFWKDAYQKSGLKCRCKECMSKSWDKYYLENKEKIKQLSEEGIKRGIIKIEKACSRCGTTKKIEEFYKHKTCLDGHRGACKKCMNKEKNNWKKTPKGIEYTRKFKKIWNKTEEGRKCKKRSFEKWRKTAHGQNMERNYNLKKAYNITLEDYDQMLESQNGACKICGKVDPGRISSKRLAVDHDHTTGKVRGILCFRCNMGLGCFNDNIEIIKKVINYLTNPEVNDKLEISL